MLVTSSSKLVWWIRALQAGEPMEGSVILPMNVTLPDNTTEDTRTSLVVSVAGCTFLLFRVLLPQTVWICPIVSAIFLKGISIATILLVPCSMQNVTHLPNFKPHHYTLFPIIVAGQHQEYSQPGSFQRIGFRRQCRLFVTSWMRFVSCSYLLCVCACVSDKFLIRCQTNCLHLQCSSLSGCRNHSWCPQRLQEWRCKGYGATVGEFATQLQYLQSYSVHQMHQRRRYLKGEGEAAWKKGQVEGSRDETSKPFGEEELDLDSYAGEHWEGNLHARVSRYTNKRPSDPCPMCRVRCWMYFFACTLDGSWGQSMVMAATRCQWPKWQTCCKQICSAACSGTSQDTSPSILPSAPILLRWVKFLFEYLDVSGRFCIAFSLFKQANALNTNV